MTTALVSKQFIAAFGDAFKAAGRTGNKSVEFMTLPEEKGARLSQADCDRVDCVFIDRDLRFSEQLYTACIDAALASKSIKWLHSASSGVWQQKFMHPLADRGVTITSSTGSNAEPSRRRDSLACSCSRADSGVLPRASTSTNGGRCAARVCRPTCAGRRCC